MSTKRKKKGARRNPSRKRGGSLYHVTFTSKVPSIKKKGILPFQTTNWVKAGDKSRYGEGQIFAFESFEDAIRWAGSMDWQFNKELGSGKISILHLERDGEWDLDDADPIAQAAGKGKWLKRYKSVPSSQITDSVAFTPEVMRQLKNPRSNIFDSPVPRHHWEPLDETDDPGSEQVMFDVGGNRYKVDLSIDADGWIWKFEHGAEMPVYKSVAYLTFETESGSMGITGEGGSKTAVIFSTVLDFTINYLKKYPNVKFISFNGSGTSRVKLYEKIARLMVRLKLAHPFDRPLYSSRALEGKYQPSKSDIQMFWNTDVNGNVSYGGPAYTAHVEVKDGVVKGEKNFGSVKKAILAAAPPENSDGSWTMSIKSRLPKTVRSKR
jgi:hypothetical protein